MWDQRDNQLSNATNCDPRQTLVTMTQQEVTVFSFFWVHYGHPVFVSLLLLKSQVVFRYERGGLYMPKQFWSNLFHLAYGGKYRDFRLLYNLSHRSGWWLKTNLKINVVYKSDWKCNVFFRYCWIIKHDRNHRPSISSTATILSFLSWGPTTEMSGLGASTISATIPPNKPGFLFMDM